MNLPLTIPYNFKPRSYQLPVFQAVQNGYRRLVLCWHRRAGKDKVCLNLMIKLIAENEARGVVGIYYYFFPTYAQGQKALWDAIDKDGFRFIDHFPKDYVKKISNSEMQIITKNGSVFQVIGTDNIDSVMGTNPRGCVFSEYSLQQPRAWDYIRPILAENEGWAVFNFTPRGRNHAWQLLQLARSDPAWFHQVLTVKDTGAIADETLDREKREMTRDFFEQEYLCVFTDGAGQFFKNIEACLWDGNLEPQPRVQYQAGIDLAKIRDWTVLTVIDLNTFKVGRQIRFNQIDYTVQKKYIKEFYERWHKPRTYIDKTGVGEPIYDDLWAAGLSRLEPFVFTEQSKKDLLINLQLKLEQRIIQIPNDETLLNELKAFRYDLGDNGQTRIIGIQGVPTDTVMSLALAVWQLPRTPLPLQRTKEELGDLINFDAYRNKPKSSMRVALARQKWLESKREINNSRICAILRNLWLFLLLPFIKWRGYCTIELLIF